MFFYYFAKFTNTLTRKSDFYRQNSVAKVFFSVIQPPQVKEMAIVSRSCINNNQVRGMLETIYKT